MIKVLLVEDNEINQEIFMRKLVKRGFEVVTADDGVQAIEKASSETPDIILMDMTLPEIDGWTATRTIKGNAQTRHIPIIALTAHTFDEDREKALKAGCDEFETKPTDFESLFSKIMKLTESSAEA